MTKLINITGNKYSRLTVLQYDGKDKNLHHRWICKCDCGVVRSYCSGDIKNGKSKSCGCLQREATSAATKTHGLSGVNITAEYRAWKQMKGRCYGKNNPKYKDYGKRGIVVCERWINSFNNFLSDMGEKPSDGHSLDRIDVDGNYEPSNCRWATAKEQANNTRRNKTYKQTDNL